MNFKQNHRIKTNICNVKSYAFMRRPIGRPPKDPIKSVLYIIKILLLNPWIFLGIIGGIIGNKLIDTPEGVVIGFILALIFGYKLLRG